MPTSRVLGALRANKLGIGIALAVAVVRLAYCASMPINTTDLVRHLFYGRLVLDRGPASAGLSLTSQGCFLAMGAMRLPWSESPYPYPPVTLFFFTAVAGVWSTAFFVKFALTALEAVAAVLIARHTRDVWLGLLYWANPVSIWWVSREGQFEALQNLLVVVALVLALGRGTSKSAFWGCAALAAAIQVKLTPVYLLPLVFARMKPALRGWGLAGFSLGLLPSVAVSCFYPVAYVIARHSTPLRYNPYFWNPLSATVFGWNPVALRALNTLASYGMLAFLAWAAIRSRDWLGHLAPFLALVTWKLLGNAQFWYMVAFPPLLLAIRDRRVRLALFMVAPLLDVFSISEMLFRAWGNANDCYFRYLGAFDVLLPTCITAR